MSDLILHHYPVSPFAEKIRLILGHKQLAWKSVFIPMVMPKPDLTALTGGYRKTPVLQIGADVYCDTALICDVLEHIAPTPTIYPEAIKGAARIVAQWADSALFPAAMAYNFQPAGVAQVFAGASADTVQAFVADRTAMRGGAARMAAADASGTYKSYLRRLANMLHGQDYLFGAQLCVADFAAYHPLWFTQERTPALAGSRKLPRMAAAMPKPTSQRPSRTWPGLGLRRSQPNRWAPSVMQRTSWRVLNGLPVSGSVSGSLRSRSSMGSRPPPRDAEEAAADGPPPAAASFPEYDAGARGGARSTVKVTSPLGTFSSPVTFVATRVCPPSA